MTVKHLEALQRQQVAMAAASDPNVANKFRAGFTECAGEVGRFPGLDGPVKRRLLQHLANCLNSASPPTTTTPTSTPTATAPITEPASTTTTNAPLQVHILRTPPQNDTPLVHQSNSSNIILTNTSGQGVQLVPTRLPNGDIALILPSSNSFRTARGTAPTTPSSSPSPSISSNSSSTSPLPMLIPLPNRTSSDSPPIAIDRLSMGSATPPRQITILTTQNPQRILIPQSNADKSVPLVAYQYSNGSEKLDHMIQRRVYVPESYSKGEKVVPTFDEVPMINDSESAVIKTRKDVIENVSSYNGSSDKHLTEENLYDRNRILMTHDGQIFENHSPRYISDKVYGQDRETLLHIPEREYYDSGIQPLASTSPTGYSDTMDDQKYSEYYHDHFERSYSPEMPKPLALVTKKKCEDYENEERPWRPW